MKPHTTGQLDGHERQTCTPGGPARFSHPGIHQLAEPWLLSGRADTAAALMDVTVLSPTFSIGRHAESDLCLRNSTVSGRHAQLNLTDRGLTLVDLESRNGSFVNGRRVREWMRLREGDVLQFGAAVFRVRRQQQIPVGATEPLSFDAVTNALATCGFQRLLREPALIPNFQPIVRMEDSKQVGYEVLARSDLFGLRTPAEMFRIACGQNAEVALSQLSRSLGVEVGQRLELPLYLNTHPSEVGSAELVQSLVTLRERFPQVGMYLEVHEAATLSMPCLASLRAHLNQLGIGLAYDDFGAGRARLLELVEVPPDIIKFDMGLIHGLAASSAGLRQLVGSLVRVVREVGVTALAEGVETREDAAICRELGFQLAQGFFFGHPVAIDAVGQASVS